jgi:hypothetical protein
VNGLAFWQQAVVAAAGGLGAALPVAVIGWWLFRRQERVRWQEALQGELAKVRQGAVVRVVEQLGRLELARHDWLADRADHERAPTTETTAAVAESTETLEKAAAEAIAAFSASLYLLPPDLARAVSDAGEALASPEKAEIRPILDRLAAVLDPYLPELPRRG